VGGRLAAWIITPANITCSVYWIQRDIAVPSGGYLQAGITMQRQQQLISVPRSGLVKLTASLQFGSALRQGPDGVQADLPTAVQAACGAQGRALHGAHSNSNTTSKRGSCRWQGVGRGFRGYTHQALCKCLEAWCLLLVVLAFDIRSSCCWHTNAVMKALLGNHMLCSQPVG